MRLSTRLITSSALGGASGILAACAVLVLAALPAHAQRPQAASSYSGSYSGDFERSADTAAQRTSRVDPGPDETVLLGGPSTRTHRSNITFDPRHDARHDEKIAAAYETAVAGNTTQPRKGTQQTILNGTLNLK